MSDTIPDVMPDLRTWLNGLGVVTKAYFRLPEKITAKYVPFMRVSRSGGAPDANSEVPFGTVRINCEIWGLTDADYGTVRQAALALDQAVHDITIPFPVGAATIINWANVLTSYESPDPDTGWPRYISQLQIGYKNKTG